MKISRKHKQKVHTFPLRLGYSIRNYAKRKQRIVISQPEPTHPLAPPLGELAAP